MTKKAKPAKGAKKTAKTTSRKPERSKAELSSDDLDAVAGGIVTPTMFGTIDAVRKAEKIVPVGVNNLSIKFSP